MKDRGSIAGEEKNGTARAVRIQNGLPASDTRFHGQGTYPAYVRICLARPVNARAINPMENGMKNSGRPFPWDPM